VPPRPHAAPAVPIRMSSRSCVWMRENSSAPPGWDLFGTAAVPHPGPGPHSREVTERPFISMPQRSSPPRSRSASCSRVVVEKRARPAPRTS